MSKWFNINYLRAPEMSKNAGIGAAFGALGDSLMKLGQIGAQREKIETENERDARDAAARDAEFNLKKSMHNDDMAARAKQLDWDMRKFNEEKGFNNYKFDKELLMKDKELRIEAERNKALEGYYGSLAKDAEYKRRRQEAEDRANVSIYRQMYPKQSEGKSDAEILALGNIMQRVKNNKKDGESELVKVPWSFHEKYGHLNVTKITKDGLYAYKSFIDELSKEADARSDASGEQAGYKDRVNDLKKNKPLIFGDDGAM